MLLHEPFNVNEDEGSLYLENERMILTSSSVFGTLRKDLIENIGMDRMKGFLIRYGWNLGMNDAKKMLQKNLPSIKDILRQGPVLHMMKGYTKVKTSHLHVDYDSSGSAKSVHVEGSWFSSYEAEEHLRQFGQSKLPVCYTLIGYASGYYSGICGHTVIFKEIACKATGDETCRYVGKSLHEWGGMVDDELQYYENKTIVKELEQTYEKLLEERNNLSTTLSIHKRLSEELIRGNNLQSVVDIVFETTKHPIIIEDVEFTPISFAGLSSDRFEEVVSDFKNELQNRDHRNDYFHQTTKFSHAHHHRLVTSIVLENKIVGYCSFIYEKEAKGPTEVDQMILERVATICSLYMLNEKNSFEALERMKGYFLEQILNGHFSSKGEILKRGRYVNINLERPYYLISIKYSSYNETLENDLHFHEQIMESVFTYFKDRSNVLIGQRNGNIVVLMQIDSKGENITHVSNRFINSLEKRFIDCTFKMGISTLAKDIGRASEFYEESITALQMAASSNKMILFEDLGVVGMLIHSKNNIAIKQKAKHLLGPLYENKTDNTELIKTLYVFLSNSCNLEKTMDDLSLSMSGLRYRIKKIESLLGQEVRNPAYGYQLFITLQVLIVEGEIKLD
ncbi:XylR N-terminal domain-containing protein [Metabacillus sediminilitoris]|uniref:PucR family transcriptional regulator n=1 Tax=Metabacillus sediminilitoris TaxID=2567941 RepID=A0A4S4C020_9BACI|nr:XylR N-terminal domain-containing protein [Metabacillus sediminilitoris]QGQ44820.1 PucR family transcriptional regulator [Metabacillus sediminilitoris]THF78832.1 PucR family transcriptional regulator [Metabacillus sediminilitoris]